MLNLSYHTSAGLYGHWWSSVSNPWSLDLHCVSQMPAIDDYQGEIFLKYIVQNKKLKEVIALLEAKYDVNFS